MRYMVVVALVSIICLLLYLQPFLRDMFDFINGFVYLFVLLYATGVHFAVALILWSLIIVTCALSSYAFTNYKIVMDEQIIAAVLEANTDEIAAFLQDGAIVTILIALVVAVVAVLTLKKANDVNYKSAFIFALFVILSVIYMAPHSVESNFPPFDVIYATRQYVLGKNILDRHDISRDNIFKNERDTASLSPFYAVVIIGESLRSDHLGISGYYRNTTPKLAAIDNVINFPATDSCATLTRNAVPCIMTRASKENLTPSKTETSFISVFKSLGYDTVWLGVQGARSVIDSPFIAITREAHKVILFNDSLLDDEVMDTDIIENIKEIVDNAASAASGKKNNLLVIHSFGSHWPYNKRYDHDRYLRWQPICKQTNLWDDMFSQVGRMKECHQNGGLINDYDNSILATDDFVSSVIGLLSDKNAILIFVSDHGESLGEDGYFLHGSSNRKEQKNGAIFVWASDKYIRNNPVKWSALRSKRNDKIADSALFHSILDCAGITGTLIDKSQSLCGTDGG